MALRVVPEDGTMTDAERKKLEGELTGERKLLAELEARLPATPQGGPIGGPLVEAGDTSGWLMAERDQICGAGWFN
jgi:hypothetical protein